QQAKILSAWGGYFPADTEVCAPPGGCFLWNELPPHMDGMQQFDAAMESGVRIAPGPNCSATGGFRRYLRLNYGRPWTPAAERALETLGTLASRQRHGG
ncbi:PLP-dependent aminotransferase family protein, partial [Burkholderia cenocepacia]